MFRLWRYLQKNSAATLVIVMLVGSGDLRAEPYLAVRHGYKCSQCHVNPTGGGMRTRFGNIYAQTRLPREVLSSRQVRSFLDGDPDGPDDSPVDAILPASSYFSGRFADVAALGGDFRLNYRTVFGGADDESSSFDLAAGNLYGALELLGGGLTVYLDEDVAPGGASAREAFGLLRGPKSSYLKAGRIMLPFGLRIEDDEAFVRELTGFNFGVQDLGVEAGWEPGPWSMAVAASNGSQGSSDDNKDKQATALVSFIDRHWRLGTHATWNNAATANRFAVGGFAGVGFGPLALLGEIDHVVDELEEVAGEPTTHQLLVYGAASYEVTRGVNLRFAYDWADPDTGKSDDSFIRLSWGIEYFPVQFVQLRAFYRYRDDIEASPRDDESVLDFELHVFF